jgi:hypothetical protein
MASRVAIVVFFTLVYCTAQPNGRQDAQKQTNANLVAAMRDIHAAAVREVTNGRSLDSQISADQQKEFRKYQVLVTPTASQNSKTLTYRDEIRLTEQYLASTIGQVKVSISAAPGTCNVRYKPLVGGLELDAGATNIVKSIDPRWYVFSCDCTSPPILQRVDCTNESTVSFSCPAKKLESLGVHP